MSKADLLGKSAAFGSAATARTSRREAFERSITGAPADTAALTDLPVTLISDNPDNPRNHLRNLDDAVENIREVGIIIPLAIATVDAYLAPRPDRAGDIDEGAQFVVVDGHRRLEAARRIGMATVPVRVDNDRVATDEKLLEAAFVANYHRDDMTDLEEAHALQALVEYYGSQTKASKRLGIPQATLSTKLSLLKLAPQLQKDLQTGVRNVEHVRNLGKLTPQEQVEKADARAQASKERTVARAKPEPAPAPVPAPTRESGPADYHGVIIPDAGPPTVPATPPPAEPDLAAAPAPDLQVPERQVPEPRVTPPLDAQAQGELERRQVKMPWHDGRACAEIAIQRATRDQRKRMMDRLMEQELADQEEDRAAATA